jgi:tRNA 2-thiouridine synthesizing protein E
MPELRYGDKNIPLDNDGFLVNQDDWNKAVALTLAVKEGIGELDEERFEIVQFMRDYYKKFHAFPILNYVCKNLNEPRNCVSEKFIDPMKAWKIAGLPKPDGIQFVAIDGEHYSMQECC